jgi:serine/threonine protein kinase
MEYVDGIVVKDLMPLPWQDAAAIMLQALDALGYAHNLGVLHRDIKPENILIDRRGMVKVMDFGIAYAVGSQRMTREKSLIGTLEYMSPERILGNAMDGRSDLYALGILFFELLTGRLPFDISNEYDLLRWQLEGSAPPVSTVANVPQFLDDVIAKAMKKAPEERYDNCAEMAAYVRALVPLPADSEARLQTLVATHARPRGESVFDLSNCFAGAAESINSGNLDAAERILRSELNQHPREESLRHYHRVTSWAQSYRAASGDAAEKTQEVEMVRAWMRVIAAARASDSNACTRELHRMQQQFPDSAPAQLLHAQEKQESASRTQGSRLESWS